MQSIKVDDCIGLVTFDSFVVFSKPLLEASVFLHQNHFLLTNLEQLLLDCELCHCSKCFLQDIQTESSSGNSSSFREESVLLELVKARFEHVKVVFVALDVSLLEYLLAQVNLVE